MAKRLLDALQYPEGNAINLNDESVFRKLIVWVEKNKIKRADPNLLKALENISAQSWIEAYDKYKSLLGCPEFGMRNAEAYYILSQAVQNELTSNREKYCKLSEQNVKVSQQPNVVAENTLDKLDFRSDDFKAGINEIAKMLKVTCHPDPLVTLRAVAKLVTSRLTPEKLQNPKEHILTGTPFPIQDTDLGFDLHDPVLNQAAKILRMLYIHDLRNLQTKANELIVGVQSITANPKTDTKLGQVGR